MKLAMTILAILAAVSGIAYASAVYTQINSNGGASLSNEASTKKAALRCYVEQWPAITWNCPSGEDCFLQSGPTSGFPSPTRVRVADCVQGTPRQCTAYLTGGGWNSQLVFEYTQGGNTAEVWTFGAPGARQSKCTISQHRLERFFEAPK